MRGGISFKQVLAGRQAVFRGVMNLRRGLGLLHSSQAAPVPCTFVPPSQSPPAPLWYPVCAPFPFWQAEAPWPRRCCTFSLVHGALSAPAPPSRSSLPTSHGTARVPRGIFFLPPPVSASRPRRRAYPRLGRSSPCCARILFNLPILFLRAWLCLGSPLVYSAFLIP